MGLFDIGGGESGVSAERIDKVGDEVFLGGASFDDLFLVFDDDFVVGDFDDFAAVDDELGVDEAFEGGAFDDDLLDDEVVGVDGEVGDFAEFGAFFGLDFEADEAKIEIEDLLDFDDVVWADELVGVVDDHAEVGIFADGFDVEDVVGGINHGAGKFKGEDFEVVRVYYRLGDLGDGAAGLDAEDGGADKARIVG